MLTLIIPMLPTSTMPTRSRAYRVGGFPRRDVTVILGKRRSSNIFGPPDEVDVGLAVGEARASVFPIRKARWWSTGTSSFSRDSS